MNHPLGEKGFEQIHKSIFRIKTTWSAGVAVGTGFVIGLLKNSRRLVLATAKHVVDFPDDAVVDWQVQQFDDRGNVQRTIAFQSGPATQKDVPYRCHNKLDVAVLVVPPKNVDGEFIAHDDEYPVRVIHMLHGAGIGSPIGWAGFPSSVEQVLGFPQLCYFEGVVSAMVDRPGFSVYFVDGHGVPGVSGGPVWHWSSEKDRLEVIGIVCQYSFDPHDDRLPGFCIFEPVNPILYYLHSEGWQVEDDPLILNRYG